MIIRIVVVVVIIITKYAIGLLHTEKPSNMATEARANEGLALVSSKPIPDSR